MASPVCTQYLYNSVLTCELPGILCAIAHGGKVNYTNMEDERKSPILLAIDAVSVGVGVVGVGGGAGEGSASVTIYFTTWFTAATVQG